MHLAKAVSRMLIYLKSMVKSATFRFHALGQIVLTVTSSSPNSLDVTATGVTATTFHYEASHSTCTPLPGSFGCTLTGLEAYKTYDVRLIDGTGQQLAHKSGTTLPKRKRFFLPP